MINPSLLSVFGLVCAMPLSFAQAFEGRITASLTRGGETQTFLYTAGTNQLRIERGDTTRPHAVNLVALDTGALTLVFPHNRSFVRLTNTAPATSPNRAGDVMPPRPMPAMLPTPAPPIGPTNLPGLPAPPAMPEMPQMPAMPSLPAMPPMGGMSGAGMSVMPMMPIMPNEPAELKAAGQKTNLLGYACEKFELRQHGEVMEIWATDQLLPFQPWLAHQPHRLGPRMLEEQWGELLQARKLFPLLALLKLDHGHERLRFEVKAITPEPIPGPDGALFQPPADYHEIEPLPF